MNIWSQYGVAIALVCICQSSYAHTMTDTTVQLGTVTIDTTRYSRNEWKWNTSTITDFRNIEGRKASEVLSDFSGIYLKNYGLGQLSSISFNGGSAAQTELQWNGIKLNNPSTGQVDFALFDMGGGDRLRISDGGANGTNLGGVIGLENQLSIDKSASLSTDNVIRIGSFGERVISSYNAYRIHNFLGATKLGYLGADNDFSFVNAMHRGRPLEHQHNAATRLLSAMQQLQYLLPKSTIIGLDLWVTDADRQLPPVMAAYSSVERQWDRSYRALLHLAGQKSRFSYALKSAYLYDALRYQDSSATINSRSATHAIRNLFTARYEIKKRLVLTGQLHYDHEIATSSGFDHAWSRDLSGALAELLYSHRKGFMAKGSIGIELLANKALPVPAAVSVGYSRTLGKDAFSILLSGAHAYRLPGLNDLYWSTGGNASLRPEKAWKGSVHVLYAHSFWLRVLTDGFYNYVSDWILWAPDAGSAIWSAQNVKRVLSRGVTAEVKMQSRRELNDKRFSISGGLSYTYTNTISLDAMSLNDNSKGKQLIYVPLHNLIAMVKLQYRYFFVQATQTYTGQRFITTDNSQYLKPYFLTHVEVGKDFYIRQQRIGLSLRIANITNQQYQLVSQRAMPGRSFEGTIRLNLSR